MICQSICLPDRQPASLPAFFISSGTLKPLNKRTLLQDKKGKYSHSLFSLLINEGMPAACGPPCPYSSSIWKYHKSYHINPYRTDICPYFHESICFTIVYHQLLFWRRATPLHGRRTRKKGGQLSVGLRCGSVETCRNVERHFERAPARRLCVGISVRAGYYV
jgi:hypothetical protein